MDAGFTTDGIYALTNPSTSSDFNAYCDQTSEGGGWMLFLSYNHIGGENNALLPGTLPSSPTSTGSDGYSHINLADVGYVEDDIDQVRFYCETSSHTRKVHFSTNNAIVKTIAISGSGAGSTETAWNTGYTILYDGGDGSTAYLPGETDSVDYSGDAGFTKFPFFAWDNYHWAIGSLDRFECDDWVQPNGYSHSTRHNVWVRNVSARRRERELLSTNTSQNNSCYHNAHFVVLACFCFFFFVILKHAIRKLRPAHR